MNETPIQPSNPQPGESQPGPAVGAVPAPEAGYVGAATMGPPLPGVPGQPALAAGPTAPPGAAPGTGFPYADQYTDPGAPYAAAGAPAAPTWPRTYAPLMRSRTDRFIGGVCGGLARYWNTDPVLLRILAVVLTLATGGLFIVVYLLAILLIRNEPYPSADYANAYAGYAAGGAPAYGTPGTPGYVPAAGYPYSAPPERSNLGWLTVSAAILLAGVMGLLALVVPSRVAMFAITASLMLAILGIGLLVGTTRGRARWLVIPAIPLAFVAWAAVAASNWTPTVPEWSTVSDSGVSAGQRMWTVSPADARRGNLEYRLGLGEAVLDLRELSAPNDLGGKAVPISAQVGLGQLTVLLPPDVELRLAATVQAGEVVLPKGATVKGNGSNPADPTSGQNLKLTATIPPLKRTDPTYVIDLDAALGAGQLEVRHEAP